MDLFIPISYLKIKHPLKRSVDLMFPGISAFVSVACITLWPSFNLFGPNGLTFNVDGLLQILPGFFITSLAAIATFNGDAYKIDEVFDGEKAVLHGEVLTRRKFLCHLFSYLSLVSLCLYLFGAICLAASANLHDATSQTTRLILRGIFTAFFAVGLSHTLGTTLIGLIFLSGRIPGGSDVARYRIVGGPGLAPTSPSRVVRNTPPAKKGQDQSPLP